MQLKEGTKVFNADGDEIGSLDRVVIDPRSQKVAELVVQSGLFGAKKKLLPIDLVSGEDERGLHLAEIPGGVEHLLDFEETRYVPVDERELVQGQVNPGVPTPSLFYYPPVWMGSTYDYPPGLGAPALGGVRGAGNQPAYVEQREEKIPEGTVAIQAGAKVVDRNGKHLGNVDQVFTGEDKRQVTHFLISRGLIFKERKLIPFGWVDHVEENEIHLAVGDSQVDRTPDYHEM